MATRFRCVLGKSGSYPVCPALRQTPGGTSQEADIPGGARKALLRTRDFHRRSRSPVAAAFAAAHCRRDPNPALSAGLYSEARLRARPGPLPDAAETSDVKAPHRESEFAAAEAAATKMCSPPSTHTATPESDSAPLPSWPGSSRRRRLPHPRSRWR